MSFRFVQFLASAGLLSLAGLACGSIGLEPGTGVFERLPDNATYGEHIRPIMGAYCDECHAATFDGSMNFVSIRYGHNEESDGVYGARQRIRIRTLVGEPSNMPPADGIPLALIDREIIRIWLDQGAPE